jgi:predicted Zn-dependent peptidase
MEEALETNGFYLGISNALRRGEDPRDMMDYPARIEALSAEVVNATAARYINPDQYVNVTLMPEAQATE